VPEWTDCGLRMQGEWYWGRAVWVTQRQKDNVTGAGPWEGPAGSGEDVGGHTQRDVEVRATLRKKEEAKSAIHPTSSRACTTSYMVEGVHLSEISHLSAHVCPSSRGADTPQAQKWH
jgi:hypothetical protein